MPEKPRRHDAAPGGHTAIRNLISPRQVKVRQRSRFKIFGSRAAGDSELVTIPEDEVCAICMETFEAGQVLEQLPCRHVYHKRCIDRWLSDHTSCCLCKADIEEMARAVQTRGYRRVEPQPSTTTDLESSSGYVSDQTQTRSNVSTVSASAAGIDDWSPGDSPDHSNRGSTGLDPVSQEDQPAQFELMANLTVEDVRDGDKSSLELIGTRPRASLELGILSPAVLSPTVLTPLSGNYSSGSSEDGNGDAEIDGDSDSDSVSASASASESGEGSDSDLDSESGSVGESEAETFCSDGCRCSGDEGDARSGGLARLQGLQASRPVLVRRWSAEPRHVPVCPRLDDYGGDESVLRSPSGMRTEYGRFLEGPNKRRSGGYGHGGVQRAPRDPAADLRIRAAAAVTPRFLPPGSSISALCTPPHHFRRHPRGPFVTEAQPQGTRIPPVSTITTVRRSRPSAAPGSRPLRRSTRSAEDPSVAYTGSPLPQLPRTPQARIGAFGLSAEGERAGWGGGNKLVRPLEKVREVFLEEQLGALNEEIGLTLAAEAAGRLEDCSMLFGRKSPVSQQPLPSPGGKFAATNGLELRDTPVTARSAPPFYKRSRSLRGGPRHLWEGEEVPVVYGESCRASSRGEKPRARVPGLRARSLSAPVIWDDE